VAVAGLGRIGRHHAANLATRVRGATLAGVADSDAGVAAAVGGEFDVPFTTSFDDLIERSSVDAVVIATPATLHAGMIQSAAEAGKHVFCEKPLADDVSAGEAAVLAAEAAAVRLQVGFQMRWDRDLRAAAARLAAGELGRIFTLHATLRDLEPPSRAYLSQSAGLFADGAVHTLDLARWLGGEIVELTAFGVAVSDSMFEELDDVDNTVIVVKFEEGGLGTLENSRVSGYGFDASAEIVAERGTLRIGHDRRHNVTLLRKDAVTVDFVSDFLERFADAYVNELEAFVEAISNGAPVAPDGHDALAASRLCAAAFESYRSGMTIRLPLGSADDMTAPPISRWASQAEPRRS
jgi:predicted dehydrogenase